MRNSISPADPLPTTREKEFGELEWLGWWYKLSAPARPAENASFKQRDTYRRALLASILLCLLMTLIFLALLISFVSKNIPNTIVTLCVMTLLVIALILNRAGRLVAEGILVVGLWTIGEVLTFLALPQLDISNVMQYDLLVVGILLAVAFFPAWSVFLIGIFNCMFVWLSLLYLTPTPALAQLIQHDGLGRMMTRPMSLTVVVMIITYLWARSGHHALARADRAETITQLQSNLTKSDQTIMLQKAQIDQSIQNISDVLTSYLNGDPTARIPLTKNNVLWNISGPINNLLGRVQRLRQTEAELARIRPVMQQLEYDNARLRSATPKPDSSPPLKTTPLLQRQTTNLFDARTQKADKKPSDQ